jgi:flagellar basal-body rod modification protein FlgD
MSTIPEQVLERLQARPPEERKRSGELGQEDFMQLMLAQVRNQDPFQPMENGEFIAQMAQFATVDGIQKMQGSISDLNTSMAGNQALTASTLVGRSVLAAGGDFTLGAEGGVGGAITADAGATRITMNVYDAAGALVARREIVPAADGATRFAFDGIDDAGARLAPGAYRLEAEALVDGKAVSAPLALARRIDSVTIGAGLSELKLNLEGGTQIGFADVREFL